MTTRITIRKWLAKKNGLPRIVDVEVIERTNKAIHVKGSAAVEGSVYCWNCNRELTHPISQQLGIGPICCGNLGIDWDADTSPEAIAALKAQLVVDTEFETWLPISQIEAEDDLDDAPRKAPKDEKPEGIDSLVGTEGRIGTFDVSPWIAEQKGFSPKTTQVRGKIKAATEKAVLIQVSRSMQPATPEITGQLASSGMTAKEFEAEFQIRIEADVVTTLYPKRKIMEKWFPVSQIADADIDELIVRAPRRVRPIEVEVEDEGPQEKNEYQKSCDDAFAEWGF